MQALKRRCDDAHSIITVHPDQNSDQADPFVERVADKMRTLAAVKPALVRLLEWQIDQELERAASRPSRGLKR